MTPTRIAFLVLAALLALLGLFAAAAARETGLAVFGWGLSGFGVGFCFFLLKRTFDEAESRAAGEPGGDRPLRSTA